MTTHRNPVVGDLARPDSAYHVGQRADENLCTVCDSQSASAISLRSDGPLPSHDEACTRCGVRYRQGIKR